MELHNLMEYEVKHSLEYIFKNTKDIKCTCEQCKLDIMAIALNSLPPKYVVSDKGILYTKAENLNQQFNTDIVATLTKAISIVNNNPRHE